jgi:hypothetical protein
MAGGNAGTSMFTIVRMLESPFVFQSTISFDPRHPYLANPSWPVAKDRASQSM